MKNKSVLALALLCGFSFSQNISYADGETVIYNKDGIVLKLSGDDKGTFKVSIENNSSKDMFGVKLKSEDIKGLKIVSGKEIEIGNVKAGEKRVLDEKELKFEIEKAIQYSIKKDKLSKTGVDGVYKIYIPIAIAGMVGAICVLVSKKRNAKRLLSVAIGTGILASSILTYTTNADVIYKNSVDVRGKINISDKSYDYVGVLMWNDVESGKINEKDNTKPDINPNKPDTKPDTKPDEPSVPNNPEEKDKVVEIEDANLKKFILDKLHAYNGEDSFEAEMKEYNFKLTDKSYRKDKNSNDIYKSDLEKIEALGIRGMDASEENLIEVSSIKGLEFCKNLKSLTISSGEIPDDYEEIRYSEGAIKDLTPLSALKNLEFLRLSHNEISDVSPLKDLTNLKSLYISHNNISDISALENLKNLENFDFAVNKVSDMSIVKNFTKLKLLDIYSNKISNIDAVKDLEKLLYFRADSNKIENIDSLKNLKVLEDLDLGSNALKDTSVLNDLTNLKKLSLKKNNLKNIDLSKLVNLEELDLEKNELKDVAFLANMLNLKNLYVQNNKIENLNAISKLTNLQLLNFSNNSISDINFVKDLVNVTSLRLSNNAVSDIYAIKNLNELTDVHIDGNKVKDFTVLNEKKGLSEKIIHNQNVDLKKELESNEKTFEVDNVFVGLEDIVKDKKIKVSSENKDITVVLENGKLKFSLTDKAVENLNKGSLDFVVNFEFENTLDYTNTSNVLKLNVELKKVEKAKPEEKDKFVDIEDAKLLKVINKNLGRDRADDRKVTVKEMESLTELSLFLKEDGSADFSENAKYSILGVPQSLQGTKDFKFAVTRGMKSIKGLEYAKNLKKLKLNENEISDISPLKELTKLEYLEIQRNRIVDIKPLEKLTNLTFLKLYNNLIEDITPLSNLTNLTGLDLHYNVTVEGDESHKKISKGITDISALKNLKNLTFLDISANRIEDVSIIKDLNKIEHLDISGNRVKNYTGLGDYIAPRLAKALNESEGSIQHAGQTVSLGQTLDAKSNEVSFSSPYVGIEELGKSIAKAFGIEEYNVFEKSSTNIKGIDASYDKETKKITLKISDDAIAENNGKEVDLVVNLTDAEGAYVFTINSIKLKFDVVEEIVAEEYKDFYYDLFNKYNKFDEKYTNLTDEANAKFSKTNRPKKDKNFTKEDFKMLKTFSIIDKNITDKMVKSLRYAENLEEFKIMLNSASLKREVTNFDFLTKTPKLKQFFYQNQDYKNAKKEKFPTGVDFSKNTALEEVVISQTDLSNVLPFKNLKLKQLSLQDNNITNIFFIKDMSSLVRLDLDNNKISNLPNLSKMQNLVTLYLRDNNISDISKLESLKNLEALHLRNNKITDISVLTKLPKLHRIYIDKNNALVNYMEVVKKLEGINTLFVDKISKDDFEWMKKFAIRNEVDATEDEDKARMFRFEKLEIPVNVKKTEIKDGFIEIDNPLKDWENKVIEEFDGENVNEEEIIKNNNLIFNENKIKIKVQDKNKFEEVYEIIAENYEHMFGNKNYKQPATVSGKVVLKINISE